MVLRALKLTALLLIRSRSDGATFSGIQMRIQTILSSTLITVHLAVSTVAAEDNTVTREILAVGTAFETELIVRDSGTDGPVVLMTGGMHGNEPAGAAAARQIAEWPSKGMLVCIPRTNPPALDVSKRYTPDVADGEKNLNRNFVVKSDGVETRGQMAPHLWKLVEQFEPDWVLDLHEGYDFGRINDDSVGSSVIADRTESTREIARKMIEAVDKEIDEADKKFMLRGPPIAGSLTRAAIDSRGLPAMILETTFKSQSLAKRCRQHRLMVAHFMYGIGMIESVDLVDHFVPASEADQFNIAMYDDGGVSGRAFPALQRLWGKQDSVTIDRVCGADIRAGVLNQFDIICCSGGSGSAQSRSLQDTGRQEVSEFVNDGGHYVGICAGSYLACSGFSWGLGILDAKTKSNHWRRGRATLEMRLTDDGSQQFPRLSRDLPVLYANGPIIEPHNQPEIPDFVTLAIFADEVADNESPEGIMVGSPAIVRSTFGKGTVVCISPHPEQTPETDIIVRQLLKQLQSEK